MRSIAPADPARRGRERVVRRARDWLPAAVVLRARHRRLAVADPDVFHVKRFLLPRFSAVMTHASGSSAASSGAPGWFTFKEALGGFALGCSAGDSWSRWRSRAGSGSGRR